MKYNRLEKTLIKCAEEGYLELINNILENNYIEVEGDAVLEAIEIATNNGNPDIAGTILDKRNKEMR